MTTSETARAWVEGFAEGWRDPTGPDAFADRFDALFADDVRFVQPQAATVVGRDAFREGFARPLFTLVPDLKGTVCSWAARGEVVFVEVELYGTLGGRPLRFRSVDKVTLRDGLAVERVANFDPLSMLTAICRRPRAWPRFWRAQIRLWRHRRRDRRDLAITAAAGVGSPPGSPSPADPTRNDE
jgi:ketosteroid isomerase-like protein